MKRLIDLLLITTLTTALSCCDDDDMGMEPENVQVNCAEIDCAIEADFYGTCILNGECWSADGTFIDDHATGISISFGKNEMNGIGEQLRFLINDVTDLNDTIWLGWVDFTDPKPNIAYVWYFYTEDHSSAGDFDFGADSELTYNDYLLIDYLNADTSIVEGRFRVRFPRRNVNSFVTHAPDSMRIECGSFRVTEL